MNILFVNNIPFNPQSGGIERVTDVLTKLLIKQYGYKVYYLSVCPDESSAYNYPAQLFVLPQTNDVDETSKYLIELVREYNINIIVNQRGQEKGILNILPLNKVKIINVIHSQPTAWIQRTCLSILEYRDDSFLGRVKFVLRILLYPLLSYYYKIKESREFSGRYQYLLETYDALVLLSDKYKNELQKLTHRKIANYNIVAIPNPNSFQRVEFNPELKENMILYVGRLDKIEKAPLRLIKIWEKLYKKHPDWKLVLVGSGGYLDRMESYVKRHHVDRVCFEGNQTNVTNYYQKASFICLTSNYEGWGMALTEGMQHGCIPVTFNSYGAASDIIEDRVSGCLIRPYSLENYAERLSELMQDDILRRQMSYNACIKVGEFNSENVVMKWDALFKRILNNHI
jgi:glycosyltransferase involved in cell wall biosynthesis